MDIGRSASSTSQPPFYGATSSCNASADVLMTQEIASFHFRHVAASICLAQGFEGVEAGALAELEKETERYLSGLLQATLANAHAGPARRRATVADALEAMMEDIPVGKEREDVIKDWKKVIGKEVRRNRVGRHKDHPSLNHRIMTPSPPQPRMITLSDDEFDLPHLNIPFRAPAGVDVKGKGPAVPSTDVPATPGVLMSSALSTPGPSTPAGFKLKLKMAARPGLPSPAIGTPLPTAEPFTLSHPPKRKTEELKHFPRKKSKEKRKAERKFLEETRKDMPDWGLDGVLPGLPARHTWVKTELRPEVDVQAVKPRVEEVAAPEDDLSAAPRPRLKPGPRGRNAREPSPVGPQPEPSPSSLFPTSQPAMDIKQERSTLQSSSLTSMPPLVGKLQSTSLEFLQSTLRDRADIRHDVGLVNYRKIGGLPSRNGKGMNVAVGGLGKSQKTGVRWKIRGLKG